VGEELSLVIAENVSRRRVLSISKSSSSSTTPDCKLKAALSIRFKSVHRTIDDTDSRYKPIKKCCEKLNRLTSMRINKESYQMITKITQLSGMIVSFRKGRALPKGSIDNSIECTQRSKQLDAASAASIIMH
jgi:hypothetical protein